MLMNNHSQSIPRSISNITLCLGLLLGLLLSPQSFASCDAQITKIGQKNSTKETYDVFSEAPIALEKQFQADIKTTCPVNLVVFALDKTTHIFKSSDQELDFTYYAQGAKTKNNQLILPSTAKDAELFFSVRFPSRQYAAAGDMNKEMVAQLWDSEKETLIAERKFNLDVSIKPSSAVFFSGVKQLSIHVDLGELTTGKKITGLPQLRVISTSPYEIIFKSDNLGKLQHTSYDKAAIDYQFSAGKQVLQLYKAEQKWLSSKITPYTGQLIPLSMSIGNTKNKPAGVYEDTLRISVRPSLVLL